MTDPHHRSADKVLRGVVKRVTYRNPENDYSVVRLAVEDEHEEVTVTGSHLGLSAGANVILRGEFERHPKFGLQFHAKSAEHVQPRSEEGMRRYLSGGFIKGIGEKTAGRIVRHFGEKSFEILHREPERLSEVPGIGRRKARQIQEAFALRRERMEIDSFFAEHNVSVRLAEKVYQKFGAATVETVKRNPYVLAYEIRGVGFLTADSLALKLGMPLDAPARLQAGLYYALEKAKEDGHCFLRREDLNTRTAKLLGLAHAPELDPHIAALSEEDYVRVSDGAVYLRSLFEAEQFVARFVAGRSERRPKGVLPEALLTQATAEAEAALGVQLSIEQREAVRCAAEYPLVAITGGPGCGKTTVIRALTTVFQRAGKVTALAAPTGKAAQKMAQVCGAPASTIHRLLGFDPVTNGFRYGPACPLHIGDDPPRQVDVLIIDEASMIDIQLARDLCSAIPRQATLILIGDKDQLPSVGPGRVFGDLLASRALKTVVLSRLFRRGEESLITTLAHTINAGITPDIPTPDGRITDAYFIERQDTQEAALMIERLAAELIPQKRGIAPHDITILTPSNLGPLGSVELNRRLQDRMNPRVPGSAVLAIGQREFRVRDRVCQRVNNYRIDRYGVFNGDTGTVYEVNPADRSIIVELWDGRLIHYPEAVLDQLSLAYALTVHRSQGSELPCVVLALHDAHYILLERQLLYTAVTRAKQLLFVVGTQRALKIAAQRTQTLRRCTLLHERIESALKEPNAC